MKKNGNVVIGIIINILMAGSIFLGGIQIWKFSRLWTGFYGGAVVLSLFSITFCWCRKCSRRLNSCTHLWFGHVTKLFPASENKPYRWFEHAGKWFYLAGITLFPVYWLVRDLEILVIYSLLNLSVFLLGTLFSCRTCTNRYCSGSPAYKRLYKE